LAQTAAKIFEIADGFEQRSKSIAGDARLSERGRIDALTTALSKEFAPAFRLARQPLRDARASIDARKMKIALPTLDRGDVAGQLAHMEIRAHVASLDLAKRTSLLFDDATDHRIIDAVLAGPSELSGLPRERHSALLDKRLRQLHGSELTVLEESERALAEAEAAAKVGENAIKVEAKLNERKFAEIMSRSPIPWLIDRGAGSIVVVKINADGTADYVEAGPAEKAAGKFFKNREEFNAAQAA
jgi:hypothetical protein